MRGMVGGLAIAVLVLSWMIGGAVGWLYLLVFALAAAAGLPIGFALFGREHGAGWVFGLLLGYALTAFIVGLPVQAGLHTRWAPVVAWLLLTTTLWALPRPEAPLVALPAWTRRDTAGAPRSADRRAGPDRPRLRAHRIA